MTRRRSSAKRRSPNTSSPPQRGGDSRPDGAEASGPDGGPEGGVVSGRLRTGIWAGALALVCLTFLVLKMFSINAYAGDEHIYLYQGKLVSQGVAPYSGFAMAHPPGQALFTAVLLEIFGYHFTLGRLIPTFWCLAAGLLLAVMVRREAGPLASVASAGLYLLAYEPLRASSHYTGVNMTIALLLAAFFAHRTGYLKVCAAFCVAAVFTRLYAIPGVMALVAWTFLSDWRRGLRLTAWGAGLGTAAFVATGIWAGFGDTIHNMISYHAQKTPMDPDEVANMKWTVLFHNSLLASLFVAALPVLVAALSRGWRLAGKGQRILPRLRTAARSQGAGLPLLASFAALLFMAVLLSMDRVWMYYFVPSFPFAAVAAGWMISRLFTGAWSLVRSRMSLSGAGISRSAAVGGALLVAALAISWFASPALESKLSYWDKEMKKPLAQRTHSYTWRDGALPDFANAAVKQIFWKEERVIGETHTSFNYLLWHESRILDVVDDIVAEIDARTRPGDAIFGDSGTVPLFALLSGREIAANEVDTNSQRYRSGNADPVETAARIDDEKTRLIILRGSFGVGGVREIRQLVARRYSLVKSFRSAQDRVFQMYERKGDRSDKDE